MKRIIIDTDPGIDDAMAILFALAVDSLRVQALTVVYGNVEVEQGVENALRILEMAGMTDIPVFRGAPKPLLREAFFAKFVHGEDGLGDIGLAAPRLEPKEPRAAEHIVSAIMKHPGEITVVALGPLTNIALAVCLEPEIVGKIQELVVMGGTAEVAQFFDPNIANDPEAAKIVFRSRWRKITMVGMDVTAKTIVTSEHLAAIKEANTTVTDFICDISKFYKRAYEQRQELYGIKDGFMFHDPTTLAYLVDPDAFDTEMRYVDIVTRDSLPPGVGEPIVEANLPPGVYGPRMRGFTVVDRGKPYGAWSQREPNVNVCLDVDSERVIELFTQVIIKKAKAWI